MGLAELDADLGGETKAGLAALDADLKGAAPTEAPAPAPSWAERTGTRALGRAKEIATFPNRVKRLVTGEDKPQSFEDAAMLALGNAPLIATGGGAAGAIAANAPRAISALAPALGRVATAIGLAKGRGEDTGNALLEGVGAVAGEAGGAVASKALGASGRALDAIRTRIGKAAGGKVSLEKALAYWKADPSPTVQQARANEIAAWLNKLDPEGVAGAIFVNEITKGATVLGKHLPPVSPGFSQAARAVTDTGLGRGSIDAALSSTPEGGALPIVAAQAMNPIKLAHRLAR